MTTHPSTLLAFALVCSLTGCGGNDSSAGVSGVDGSKQIESLSAAEREQLCSWGVAEQGGSGRMAMCPGGGSVTVKTSMECVDQMRLYESCDLTAGQLEACFATGDPCGLITSMACAPVVRCAFSAIGDAGAGGDASGAADAG